MIRNLCQFGLFSQCRTRVYVLFCFFSEYNSCGWGALGCWASEREDIHINSVDHLSLCLQRADYTEATTPSVADLLPQIFSFASALFLLLASAIQTAGFLLCSFLSHSNPEEIKNLDGSWVVTVTVLSDLYPPLALHPSVLLFPQPVFASPPSSALHLCLCVSATSPVYCPSSPELYVCLSLSPFFLH